MGLVDRYRIKAVRLARLMSWRELWKAIEDPSPELTELLMEARSIAEISDDECKAVAAVLGVTAAEIRFSEDDERPLPPLIGDPLADVGVPSRLGPAITRVIWRMMTTRSYSGRHVGTSWEACETRTEREATRYLLELRFAYEGWGSIHPYDETLWSFYVGRLAKSSFYTNGF